MTPKLTPEVEAMLALADKAAHIHRQTGDDVFIVELRLGLNDSIIVRVQFPYALGIGMYAEVSFPAGMAGLGAYREQRMKSDFIHLIRERLSLESITAQWIAARMRRAANAYA